MNIRENLKAYLDGELSSTDAALVEQAIGSDPDLKRETEEMSRLSNAIKAFAHEFQSTGYQKAADAAVAKAQPNFWQKYAPLLIVAPVLALMYAVVFPVFAQSKLTGSRAQLRSVQYGSAKAEAPASSPSERAGGVAGRESAGGFGSPESKARDLSATADESQWQNAAEMDHRQGANLPQLNEGNVARLVVKAGNVAVLVTDVAQAGSEIPKIARSFGGFVVSSSANNVAGSRRATYTIKVSANNFDVAMDALANLGEVTSSNSSGEDVTTQVADIDARIKVMKAEEEQYAEVLKAARSIGQILEVKRQLSRVRQEIESLTAQSQSLKRLAVLSTITATLTERAQPVGQVPQDWFGEAKTNAMNALGAFGVQVGRILVYVGIFAVVWVPALVVYLWLKRRNKPLA